MIIYVDFDGVLVNTPKYIRKSLKNNEILNKLPWDIFLSECHEINQNFLVVKEISKKFNVIILTHVCSEFEAEEKRKYLTKYLYGIEVITVPYEINKNDYVNPKNNILIDDYNNNIKKWENSGGIGIHFTQNDNIINLLNKYVF